MYDGYAWPSVEQGCRAFCGRGRGFAACCTLSSLSPSYLFMHPFWDARCCRWAAQTSEKSISRTNSFYYINININIIFYYICYYNNSFYSSSFYYQALSPVILSDHTFILALFFLWILTYCCYHILFTRDSIFPLHPLLTHHHFEPFHSLQAVRPMTNGMLSTWV